MSNETKTVAELRETLQQLKTDLIDDDNVDYNLFGDALSALAGIGKSHLIEFKNEVYELLDFWQEDIRSEAIATLGFDTRLGVSKAEFADKAYEIWKNDPSDSVKRTALTIWSGYYIRTKDNRVLTELYKILKDDTFGIGIRTVAYIGVFDVVKEGYPASYEPFATSTKLLKSANKKEFESKVDWDAIHAIMKKYAPEALE